MKASKVYEFSKMYYNWACECLAKDEKNEELAFFKLGVDLSVRQKELIEIKYSQIDFPYVNNIEVKKITKNITVPSYYPPREISKDTHDLLNVIGDDGDLGRIFKKSSQEYIESIRESIGDGHFNGHYMRKLGSTLRVLENNKVGENNV